MKSAGDVVEILEAFDLTGSLRDAARLAGCSPMTVARYVRDSLVAGSAFIEGGRVKAAWRLRHGQVRSGNGVLARTHSNFRRPCRESATGYVVISIGMPTSCATGVQMSTS